MKCEYTAYINYTNKTFTQLTLHCGILSIIIIENIQLHLVISIGWNYKVSYDYRKHTAPSSDQHRVQLQSQ